ncbi:MAG: hypothetical protein QOJ09_1162 [Actinomycetota bacterium]|jgi:hypothetical protein|nr:hypothetical protein [Frankiales bacterium]MDQ1373824.1 hypothetical protein [Actinomycetota bacterium]
MQVRRVATVATLAVLAAGAYAPALAAPKPFSGSYQLTLLPDPTPNAFVAAGMADCKNVNPASVDKHPLTVPRAGRLNVVLDSPDPTGKGVTDWDLYVLDSAGDDLANSSGGTSHEEVDIKFKAKTAITIVACNLAGQPNGTVTYKLK